MSTYLYCGQPVATDVAIPDLSHARQSKDGFSFCLEISQEQSTELPCSHQWKSSTGEILLSYSWQNLRHWLRFPGLADFRISADAKEISCYPLVEVPQETIQHLLLDQVLPRCLAHQGRILLHASAVQVEQGLILFLGDSGAGKSTLAGDFHQAGHPAISDDCVWLKESGNQIVGVPSYGGLRLWEDSLQALFSAEQNTSSMAHYTTKKRVLLQESGLLQSGDGLPILAVIMLTPPDQVTSSEIVLERISRRETYIAMLKQTFQLDLTDLERMSHHAQALGRMVPRLPAYRLSMPREYDLLPLVRQRILDEVGSAET